jgi:drug/metabolite transporter (DMT)-like permease
MLGEIIALLANLTFVISNAMFRKTEKSTSPSFINMFRTGIGMITFLIISLIIGLFQLIFLLPWTLWLILIISFVFGQVIGDTFYFTAQKDLGTTKALAVSMTFPFFTFILEIIFLGRTIEFLLIPSALLITIGVLIIAKFKIKVKNKDDNENITSPIINSNEIKIDSRWKSLKSTIYGLGASIGWAFSVVLIDYGTNQIDEMLSTGSLSSILGNVIRFPFAFLLLLILVKYSKKIDYEVKTRKTWIWLTIASIIGTSLGVYFFTEGTRLAGASVMALIASANPLFALPISYLLNREKITLKGFIGVIFTILGIILILI